MIVKVLQIILYVIAIVLLIAAARPGRSYRWSFPLLAAAIALTAYCLPLFASAA